MHLKGMAQCLACGNILINANYYYDDYYLTESQAENIGGIISILQKRKTA